MLLQTQASWKKAQKEEEKLLPQATTQAEKSAAARKAAKLLVAAHGMTKLEFRNNLIEMFRDMRTRLASMGTTWQEYKPWFSHDNIHSQSGADKVFKLHQSPTGSTYNLDDYRLPLPAGSPDCHRVIEHIFNQLAHQLYTEIYRGNTPLNTAVQIATYLRQQFFKIKPDTIKKDVAGLPKLYKWIVDNDGAWPPRALR
jgi:hypothetical protein